MVSIDILRKIKGSLQNDDYLELYIFFKSGFLYVFSVILGAIKYFSFFYSAQPLYQEKTD